MKQANIEKIIEKLDAKLIRLTDSIEETNDHKSALYKQLDLFKKS